MTGAPQKVSPVSRSLSSVDIGPISLSGHLELQHFSTLPVSSLQQLKNTKLLQAEKNSILIIRDWHATRYLTNGYNLADHAHRRRGHKPPRKCQRPPRSWRPISTRPDWSPTPSRPYQSVVFCRCGAQATDQTAATFASALEAAETAAIMTPNTEQRLRAKHPHLLTKPTGEATCRFDEDGVMVGDGWFGIVDELASWRPKSNRPAPRPAARCRRFGK